MVGVTYHWLGRNALGNLEGFIQAEPYQLTSHGALSVVAHRLCCGKYISQSRVATAILRALRQEILVGGSLTERTHRLPEPTFLTQQPHVCSRLLSAEHSPHYTVILHHSTVSISRPHPPTKSICHWFRTLSYCPLQPRGFQISKRTSIGESNSGRSRPPFIFCEGEHRRTPLQVPHRVSNLQSQAPDFGSRSKRRARTMSAQRSPQDANEEFAHEFQHQNFGLDSRYHSGSTQPYGNMSSMNSMESGNLDFTLMQGL